MSKKSILIELTQPVEFEGETLENLILPRLKVKNLVRMEDLGLDDENAGGIVKMRDFLAEVTDRPSDFFDEMDAGDMLRCFKSLVESVQGGNEPAVAEAGAKQR